jgi:thiol-disulfide isomerase/thioredoxin
MRFRLIILLFSLCYFSYSEGLGQSKVEVIKFEDLQKIMNLPSDTTLVIHFWATWCKPCVEELPIFEKISQDYFQKKVKVLFISMDFPKDVSIKVPSFLKSNNIKSNILLLDEPDYNSWIDVIDKDWSGTIPATLILNTNMRKRKFFEGQVRAISFLEELKTMLPSSVEN